MISEYETMTEEQGGNFQKFLQVKHEIPLDILWQIPAKIGITFFYYVCLLDCVSLNVTNTGTGSSKVLDLIWVT